VIAGLLLAAGEGTRFGGDKLLAPLGGESVLRRSASALGAEVDRLIVVVPPSAAARIAELRALEGGSRARVVENPEFRAGMGSSLRAGVAALESDVEAVIVSLADQPLVRRDVIRALIERWRAEAASAVAPQYRNGQGNPVLFSRAVFPALARLAGDVGARAVLRSLGSAVSLLVVDDDIPADVDTPDALRALEDRVRRDS
jgi:CTP:molybdopterin cytidylyltransferase MocA